MSVYVIRAFIEQREKLAANAAILKLLAEIDESLLEHDTALRDIYQKLLPPACTAARTAPATDWFLCCVVSRGWEPTPANRLSIEAEPHASTPGNLVNEKSPSERTLPL
jgi:hypothetical protein